MADAGVSSAIDGMTSDPLIIPDAVCPYQGLRTFEVSDRRYFCGRKAHVDQILERFEGHRFISVVGLSGSGKSSLVRAGVIPELRADRLRNTSSDWLIVTTTPENAPLNRMGIQLQQEVSKYFKDKREDQESDLPSIDQVERWGETVGDALNSGSLGLAKAIATARLKDRTRVLLVVDQFEELFRFWALEARRAKDEVEVFIHQLLELTNDPDGRVYVVITMRSEYLGDCARYEGLAEAVNSGLYLTPRLNRKQLREAITLPAERCLRRITPELVRRLLNDVASDPDQLPVLQHALMRCWEKGSETIDEAQYLEIGGPKALNKHAEELFKSLERESSPGRRRDQRIAEAVFKRITKRANREGGSEGSGEPADGTRDAATLHTICAHTGFSQEDVSRVIEVFRQRDCAFLRPGAQIPLVDETLIDITHESLIRKWDRLGAWVHQEAKSADAYLALATEAVEEPDGRLSRRRVTLYLEERNQWSSAWAGRYGNGNFKRAIRYLEDGRSFYAHQDAEGLRRQEEESARALQQQKDEAEAVLKRQQEESARILQQQRAEAEAQLRRQEEETQKHQRALEIEQEQRRLELAKWKRRLLIMSCVGVIALVIVIWSSFLKSKTVRAVVTFQKTAAEASSEGFSMDRRVPAAISAAVQVRETGVKELEQEFREQVPLNQWEIFSTLRKGTPLNDRQPSENWFTRFKSFLSGLVPGPKTSLTANQTLLEPGMRVSASCGVSVNMARHYLAIANDKSVELWDLSKQARPSAVEFEHANCVQISQDGALLLSSSNPYDENGSKNGVTVLNEYSVGATSLKLRARLNGEFDDLLASSFVEDSSKIAVLTRNAITLCESSGRCVVTLCTEDAGCSAPQLPEVIKAGFFSADGRYLIISYIDNHAWIYDLRGKSVPRMEFVFQNSAGDHDDMLQRVAFSKDGSSIAFGTSLGYVGIRGNPFLSGSRPIEAIGQMNGSISAIAIGNDKDGDLIAAGDVGKNVAVFKRVIDQLGGQPTPSYTFRMLNPTFSAVRFDHQGQATWVGFTEDGNYLITASQDHKARVFEARSGVEMVRIPHNALMVFAAGMSDPAGPTNDSAKLVISVSQDGDVELTDINSGEPTIERTWQPGLCSPGAESTLITGKWPSAVSKTGAWAWTCGGQIVFGDNDKRLPLTYQESGSVRSEKVEFDKSGSAVVWLSAPDGSDGQTWIHYARWNDQSGKPTEAVNEMKLIDARNSAITFSSNGDYIGLLSTSNKGTSQVDVFRVVQSGAALRLDQLTSSMDLSGKQVVSLALSDEGSVAAGTANSEVVLFKRREKGWDKQIMIPVAAAGGSETGLIITAVAFTKGGDLLIDKEDRTIWLYSTGKGSFLYPSPGGLAPGNDAQADTVVFDSSGDRFAAISGSHATFFTLENEEPKKELTLDELGSIQSLAFAADNSTVFTTVFTGESLVRIRHNLSVEKHEWRICDNQPLWAKGDLVKNCKKLFPKKQGSFWPDQEMEAAASVDKK